MTARQSPFSARRRDKGMCVKLGIPGKARTDVSLARPREPITTTRVTKEYAAGPDQTYFCLTLTPVLSIHTSCDLRPACAVQITQSPCSSHSGTPKMDGNGRTSTGSGVQGKLDGGRAKKRIEAWLSLARPPAFATHLRTCTQSQLWVRNMHDYVRLPFGSG